MIYARNGLRFPIRYREFAKETLIAFYDVLRRSREQVANGQQPDPAPSLTSLQMATDLEAFRYFHLHNLDGRRESRSGTPLLEWREPAVYRVLEEKACQLRPVYGEALWTATALACIFLLLYLSSPAADPDWSSRIYGLIFLLLLCSFLVGWLMARMARAWLPYEAWISDTGIGRGNALGGVHWLHRNIGAWELVEIRPKETGGAPLRVLRFELASGRIGEVAVTEGISRQQIEAAMEAARSDGARHEP